MQLSETVEIRGHLLDSGTLTKILDDIRDYGGDYVIERFDVGKDHDDESYAQIVVTAADDNLSRLVNRLQGHGVNPVDPGEVEIRPTDADGVFPDDFYSTTNLETFVRLGGEWIRVENPEMDCGLLVVDNRVRKIPVSEVKAGDRIVCGTSGVRVVPVIPQVDRSGSAFEFMNSEVSSEKPQALLVRQIADQMREVKAGGGKILWVGGPAVVHTGAAPAMVALVRPGSWMCSSPGTRWQPTTSRRHCSALRSGSICHAAAVSSTHEHHIRAINKIRRGGSTPRPSRMGC